MENPEITLSEYWRIVRKRKWTIVSVFILVILSTFIFTKLQTPIYVSQLELKIEKQQPVISIIPNVQNISNSPRDFLSREMSKTIDLETEIRLIKSLPIMQKVVEKIEVLPSDPEEREQIIHSLSRDYQSRVQIEQIGDTNIVNIRVESNDPQEAALMATAIADVYIVENVASRRKQSEAQVKYIENQLEVYKTQLEELETNLQKFKQNEKVFEVTTKIKETLTRMTVEGTFEFEEEMLKIDQDLRNLDSTLLKKGPSEVLKVFNEIVSGNYIFIGLKRRLLELEFQRFLLLIDYTEKHPEVIVKDKIIAEIKNKIVNMIKGFSNLEITSDVESDLSLLIRKLFLETRKEVLYRIVNKFYEDKGSLSPNQLEYLSLTQNIQRLLDAYDTMLKQRDEGKLNLARVIDDVINVVSPATTPKKPVKPNAAVNYLVSSVAGLLLGILMCFLRESIDSSISTISDVEHELKLSILGIIPHMKKEEVLIGREEDYQVTDKKLLYQQFRLMTVMHPKSWPAESLKMLRTNLVHLMKPNNYKTILFTSSDKQEGKSTIVTNIVLSMAQLGKKTVLVESNMRRPTAYKIFGLTRDPGLSDILMGNITWQDAIKSSIDILTGGLDIDRLLQMPGIDNLKVITCGRAIDNVSELLNSKKYDQLLQELKNNFDVIIIDCSPVMPVPDAITLSDKVDGVVLVYKVGHTSKEVLRMAKNNLLNAHANILGIVLNNIKSESQVGYSAYYYRYYAEDEKKKKSVIKWKTNKEDKDNASDKKFSV